MPLWALAFRSPFPGQSKEKFQTQRRKGTERIFKFFSLRLRDFALIVLASLDNCRGI